MRKIEITILDQIKLDAGAIEESHDHYLVHPPTIPMIEQLISELDALPQCEGDFQIQHLGVAFTALCVRWGSYLSTLMDPATELNPCGGQKVDQQPILRSSSSPVVMMQTPEHRISNDSWW
jgi:hypothetical protein